MALVRRNGGVVAGQGLVEAPHFLEGGAEGMHVIGVGVLWHLDVGGEAALRTSADSCH